MKEPAYAERLMNTAPGGTTNLQNVAWLAAYIICALLCLFVVFRPFWTSHFDLVLSDPVDGRFSIAILEHWTKVFQGHSPLASPNFFFPERGVLGYSDTFFLTSIPYAIVRLLGAGRYLSFEITMMFLTTVGFGSMLYLLRCALRFSEPQRCLELCYSASPICITFRSRIPSWPRWYLSPCCLVLAWKYWNTRKSTRRFSSGLCLHIWCAACSSFVYVLLYRVVCGFALWDRSYFLYGIHFSR